MQIWVLLREELENDEKRESGRERVVSGRLVFLPCAHLQMTQVVVCKWNLEFRRKFLKHTHNIRLTRGSGGNRRRRNREKQEWTKFLYFVNSQTSSLTHLCRIRETWIFSLKFLQHFCWFCCCCFWDNM